MSEALVRYLAREADRRAVAADGVAPHPDENDWALLADGLIPAERRDALLAHAAQCAVCRRRVGAIAAAWDDTVLIANGAATRRPLDAAVTRPRATPRAAAEMRPSRPGPRLIPALAGVAACAVLAMALARYQVARESGTLPRFDDRRLLAPTVDLTVLGVGLGDAAPRTARRVLSDTEYAAVIRKLSPRLNQPAPPAEMLELAARAALSAGEYAQAARYAARWRGRDAPSAAAQNAYGLAAFQLGAHAEALAAFQRALELAPDRVEYVLNAGLAASRLGDAETARRALRRVVTLAPNHPRRSEIDGLLRRVGE